MNFLPFVPMHRGLSTVTPACGLTATTTTLANSQGFGILKIICSFFLELSVDLNHIGIFSL